MPKGASNVIDIKLLDKSLEAQENRKRLEAEDEALEKQTLSISADAIRASQVMSQSVDEKVYGINSSEMNVGTPGTATLRDLPPSARVLEVVPYTEQANEEGVEIHNRNVLQQHGTSANQEIAKAVHRPSSHDGDTRNKKKKSGGLVRNKRVKSTRPGGIRGGMLIQDRFGSQTPVESRQARDSSMKKMMYADTSTGFKLGYQSTNAGLSQKNSKLAMSYGPTSLVKIGHRSVQRLRPRVPSSNTI